VINELDFILAQRRGRARAFAGDGELRVQMGHRFATCLDKATALEDALDQGKKLRIKDRGRAYLGLPKTSGSGRRYLRALVRNFPGLAADVYTRVYSCRQCWASKCKGL
jgi:hypothetical protein